MTCCLRRQNPKGQILKCDCFDVLLLLQNFQNFQLNFKVILFQTHSESLWFSPAAAGSSPANHPGLPQAAGFMLPGQGASSLGWDPSLAASGPGTADGNLGVRIVHRQEVVDQVAPYSGND